MQKRIHIRFSSFLLDSFQLHSTAVGIPCIQTFFIRMSTHVVCPSQTAARSGVIPYLSEPCKQKNEQLKKLPDKIVVAFRPTRSGNYETSLF